MKTVKIDIFAGFLGAGKTTLINKFLQDAYVGEKIALLENEFGEIGIDGDLLKGHDLTIKELANGCICCTLQGNFISGIQELVAAFPLDRILIEPTGIARLPDILLACNEAAKTVDAAINAVITVVDATMFPIMMDVSGEFYQRQIAEGQVIVLSAVQNLEDDMPLAEIVSGLRELNPHAPIFSETWDELEVLRVLQMAEMLGAPGKTAHQAQEEHQERHHHDKEGHHHHHHDNEGYTSYAFYTKGNWSEEDIRDFSQRLQSGEFGVVFRGKGFLPDGETMRKMDYVYGRTDITETSYTGEGKFVLIGKELKEAALADYLGARES